MTPRSKSKYIKTAMSVAWWAALVILAALLLTVFGAKLRGEVPNLFGYSVLHIVSGSMEPDIGEGEYILVRAVDPSEVGKDDIISFYSSDPAIFGMPNTHRVAEEPIITDEGIEFVTKGTANPTADSYNASGDRLIGKYVTSLHALGAFSSFLGGGAMIAIFIVLQLATAAVFVCSLIKREHSDTTAEREAAKIEKIKKAAVEEYLREQSEASGEFEDRS